MTSFKEINTFILDSHKLSDGRTISYVRSTKMMTYIEANSWCTEQKGNLPISNSNEENNFLAKLGSTWLQQTTQDLKSWHMPYTNWVLKEPSGDGQQIQLIVGKRWGVEWGYGGWNDQKKTGTSLATCYLAVKKSKGKIKMISRVNDDIPLFQNENNTVYKHKYNCPNINIQKIYLYNFMTMYKF